MKTSRGFEIQHFTDDYGVECSIQESSDVVPHIWLGADHAHINFMYKDKFAVEKAITETVKDDPSSGDCGWCTVKVPDGVLLDIRMHLSQKQAKELAKKLQFFAKHGYLKEEKNVFQTQNRNQNHERHAR